MQIPILIYYIPVISYLRIGFLLECMYKVGFIVVWSSKMKQFKLFLTELFWSFSSLEYCSLVSNTVSNIETLE